MRQILRARHYKSRWYTTYIGHRYVYYGDYYVYDNDGNVMHPVRGCTYSVVGPRIRGGWGFSSFRCRWRRTNYVSSVESRIRT